MYKNEDRQMWYLWKTLYGKGYRFQSKDEIIEQKYGAIVVATGYDLIDLSKFGEYSYDHPNVITSLEFERLTNAAGPTHGNF